MTVPSETELWLHFKNGDKKAFEAIYHQYYGTLLNYGVRLKQDNNFVEEAVQDLFVKLWQNKQNLNQPTSLKHYLLKSLRNIIYNKLNIIQKEFYVGNENDILNFELHIPKDHSDYPQQLLRRLMENLTERQKEAVYLFYLEDLSYQEISDLLKIKIGGTYKLLYRAVDKMKSGLKQQQSARSGTITDNPPFNAKPSS